MSRRIGAERAAWMQDAACIGTDIESWFPKSGDRGMAVRRICASCPVRLSCLKAAMEDEGRASKQDRFGIRGGLSPLERTRHAQGLRGDAVIINMHGRVEELT